MAALKILLVDPNEDWLYSAKEHFEKLFYSVEVVSNGKDAQLALYNDKFFAVVLNLETKNHSGVQVLKFIKANHPGQMVILVMEEKLRPTDKKEENEFHDNYTKLGASEILFKPFEFEELRIALEGHQSVGQLISSTPKKGGVSPEEQVNMEDDNFTKVKIEEFYISKPVLFNIFIKLGSGRYVKILHAGDSFSKERLDKYKNDKGVEYLHFQKSDIGKFVKFNNYVSKKIIDNDQVSAHTKVKMVQNVADKYLEQAFTEGLKPQIVEQGKEIVQNVYDLVEKEKELYSLLRSYQDFDPSAYTHAFLVTLFSSSIIKQFEWQSQTTIETTALACMFHDIGKLKLPPELKDLKVEDMTEEQFELYKEHPEMGAEMVDGNRLINNSVKQIIIQHHEYYNGAGFPYGKKGSRILTLSNIVCLANDFVDMMVNEDLKPVEALKRLLADQEMVARYNSSIVQNLIKVFVNPDQIMKEHQLPSNSRVVNKKAS